MQLKRLVEGHGGLTRQTDHAQAVGAVRGDFKLHHMVVAPKQYRHVVAGPAVLVEDENAVGDAVGELLLLSVQIGQGADKALLGVVGHTAARVDVLAVGHGLGGVLAQGQGAAPAVDARVFHGLDLRRQHLAENPAARLKLRGDGGLVRIEGVVIVQNRGGLDRAVVKIVGGELQLLEGAEHPVGFHAAQLAAVDLLAAGQQRAVQRRGHQVAHMDVPRAGADLNRLLPAHVELADQHVVGIGVLLEGEDTPHLHVFHPGGEVFGDLHLGAGDAHGLGKRLVAHLVQAQVNKLIEPFS